MIGSSATASQLSVEEVIRCLKSLAKKGLISELNGIPWDADPDLPRTFILHKTPANVLKRFLREDAA